MPHSTTNDIPSGFCCCGCGAKTTIAKETDRRRGQIKGKPARFIQGHNSAKPFVVFDAPRLDPSTRVIQLTQGKVALVDAGSYEELSRHKWHARQSGQTWYAQRTECLPDGTKRTVKMHRVILGAPDSTIVDHINGDGLRNTRDNLRLATKSQNNRNAGLGNANSSGYKGVSWQAPLNKWRAQIQANGKVIHLGYFAVALDAARAYDEAARLYCGEFAWLNFNEQA